MDLERSLMKLGIGGHVAIYRLSNGRVGGTMGGSPVILLTTRGRRSGEPRTTPLMRIEHDGRLHVIASAAGSDSHPAWFHNLVAEPNVVVRDRDDVFAARAEVLDGKERDAAYAAAVEEMDGFADYERRTDRVIPVVRLHRDQ